MLKRIQNLIDVIISWFVEAAENKVPLERQLARDRQRRADKVHGMMDKATDIGEWAELAVQALAERRITATNLREELKRRKLNSEKARKAGETATMNAELAQAAELADELADVEAEVADLETDVAEATKSSGDAQQMVLQQAADLERLARKDARLVGKVRMSEMKEQSLQMREQLLNLIPEEQTNVRQRAQEAANRREARVKARTRIVDALWQQQQRRTADRVNQVSARGAEILAEVDKELGIKAAEETEPPEEKKAAAN